jgi:hypothetical protein
MEVQKTVPSNSIEQWATLLHGFLEAAIKE